MRLGFFQTEAVFLIYVTQVLLILFAWFLRFHSEWFLLLGYGLFSVLVVWLFTVADQTGWKLKRFDLIDRVIKGHLKKFRGKWLIIRISFRVVSIGFPLLLMFLAFLPTAIPSYLSFLAAGLAGAIMLAWVAGKTWLGRAFMPCMYIFIPLLVYAGEQGPAGWLDLRVVKLHYLLYVVLAFFAVTTLKYTRRSGGFRITPMDFIVLVLALAVTALPREILPEEAVKNVIPKILTLFFGYEVLVGELRGDIRLLAGITIATLVVVCARGIL